MRTGHYTSYREEKVFAGGAQRLLDNVLKTLSTTSLMSLSGAALMGFVSAIIMYLGARQVLAGPGNHKREALRPLLAESDGLDYARRRAEELACQARAELACLPPSPCRAILESVTDRVVHRNH